MDCRKQTDLGRNPEIDAGGPEITSAMIDAGLDCLSRFDREWDSSAQIVIAVFLAMVAARDDAAC
jgi:hypothetical protein